MSKHAASDQHEILDRLHPTKPRAMTQWVKESRVRVCALVVIALAAFAAAAFMVSGGDESKPAMSQECVAYLDIVVDHGKFAAVEFPDVAMANEVNDDAEKLASLHRKMGPGELGDRVLATSLAYNSFSAALRGDEQQPITDALVTRATHLSAVQELCGTR